MDHGAGRAPRAEHHPRRRRGLSGLRRPSLLRQPLARRVRGRAPGQSWLAAAALVGRRVGGLADPPRADRFDGGAADAATAALGASILAPARHAGRSRRARHPSADVSEGSARPDHGDGARVDGGRRAGYPGGRVRAARRAPHTPEGLLMLRAPARVIVPCDGRSLGRMLEQLSGADDDVTPLPEPSGSALRRLERSTPPVFRAIRRITASLLDTDTPPDGAEAVRGKGRGKLDEAADVENAPVGPPLRLDNGIGGLTDNGDYEIRLRGATLPPAPWANVVANPRAGFVVTERGGGFTWTDNR